MKYLHYGLVVFLALLSAGGLAMVAGGLETGGVWLWLLGLWVLAVVMGRMTLAWLRARSRRSRSERSRGGSLSAVGAAFGSSLGLVLFQGLGPSTVLMAASGLGLAFVTGLMLMNPYGHTPDVHATKSNR